MCETGGISETLLPKEADYFFKASLYTIDGGQNDHRTRQGKCSQNVKPVLRHCQGDKFFIFL
ncbi:hypothetical protein NC651_023860 [Populus alba x Populus x berolinensis]|nr:hypothetical protein NC651_023860 [Populus alba x Populus x berolinensis]